MKLGLAAGTPAQWTAFTRRYRREMSEPASMQALDLLAALSHTTDFSVGCYCADASHCHRSILRALLQARGARIVDRS